MVCVLMLFFFLQAEDGIRYLTVTGVQTCALPICPGGRVMEPRHDLPGAVDPQAGRDGVDEHADHVLDAGQVRLPARDRSGERRVGKEGRSRGAADHLKKKKKRVWQ